jgi:osmoprotectant transport system permease protein
VGIPAGILLSRPSMVGRAERFMQFFNIGNTVPPLAVLAIALGILGIGSGPAIFALFLASLLPIVRNTYEGLKNVQGSLKEAAVGIGMTPRQVLWKVELPNAVPIIIGGVRVALAINVGTAPLAFLIGANSLGSLIFPGIALNNQPQLLLGAACTALLALLLDGLVTLASRLWLERGLRPS